MPIFGVASQEARGHVVTAVLIAMVAMLFTALSYGRMARYYPSAGSAYTYVSQEINPGLGYLVGWSIVMDYLLNPLICTIWCSKAAGNFFPFVPYAVWVCTFAIGFTALNLHGIETSARVNQMAVLGMSVVVAIFFGFALNHILGRQHSTGIELLRPFYDPSTFSWRRLSSGTALAALTYIGFDGVSTLSEEVENPRRNILLATVLTCVITGILAALEVYAAQLIWPDYRNYPDVDTAFVHVAARAGGRFLFVLLNLTLLVATVGSGFASQLGAARLLYGMGRDNSIPRRFFGSVDAKRGIPVNNVLLSGAIALTGALVLSYELGTELLNFGAFIAFMGVNAAAIARYCVRGRWTLSNAVPSLLGFAFCLYIWLSLSLHAKFAGIVWLGAGLLYGAMKGKLKRSISVEASS